MQEPKKKSLFSQRIKQSRQKQSHPESGSFPQAVKIDCILSKKKVQQKQIDAQVQMMQMQMQNEVPLAPPQETEHKFVQKLLGSQLKPQQIQEIHESNMKSIQGMSKEQIEHYQQMIMGTMSQGFLNKMKKKNSPFVKNKQKKQEHLEIKQQTKNQSMKMQEQNTENAQKIQQQTPQQSYQPESPLGLESISINVKTKRLLLLEKEYQNLNESLISTHSLKLMLQSENNQTQIIGSQLLLQICKQLYQQVTVPVVFINGMALHLTIITSDLYEQLFCSLIHQIKYTKFKSCYMEMLQNLIQCYNLMKFQLVKIDEGKCCQELSMFLLDQSNKTKAFVVEGLKFQGKVMQICEIAQKVKEEIDQKMYQKTYLTKQTVSQLLKENVDLILQQINIQLIHNSKPPGCPFLTFLQHIAKQLIPLSLQQKQKTLIQILYPLSLSIFKNELNTNKMSKQYFLIKQALFQWTVFHTDNKYLLENIQNKVEEEKMFEILMITSVISEKKYMEMLAPLNKQQKQIVNMSNQVLANIITFIGFEEYFRNPYQTIDQKKKQCQQIEQTLKWLLFKLTQNTPNYLKKIPEIIFRQILSMFTNALQPSPAPTPNSHNISYTDISSQLLQKILCILCSKIQQNNLHASLWFMLPEQKIKAMIDSYNYDSFGNYPFTKLILFLAASTPNKKIQALLLEQVVSRYPFLFYYASQSGDIYGNLQMYLKGNVTAQMKVIYQMLEAGGNKTENKTNLLVRYLSKK